MKKILKPFKELFEWIIKIYLKIRPKKTYWTIAVPLTLIIINDFAQPFSVYSKSIEAYANEVENPILRFLLNFLSACLDFDLPTIITVFFIFLLLLFSAIKILEGRNNPQLKTIIDEIESKKIKKEDVENALKKQVEKQLHKQVNSGKYIPEIFIETGNNRENLRYFSNPVLFSQKIYETIKNADFRIFNRKNSKLGGNHFEVEIENFDLPISIDNYIEKLTNWIENLNTKLTEITESKISRNDIYSYESKIKDRIDDASYLKSRVCLITETAGQGKTNFICDFANRFVLGTENPAIFLTGTEINPNDIRETIIKKAFPNKQNLNFENFIEKIGEICEERKQLFLIIIDGINENINTQIFSNTLESFISDILDYHFVKVIISCRKEYYDHNFLNVENSSFKNAICRLNSLGMRHNEELNDKLFDLYFYHFDIKFESVARDVFDQLMSNFLLFRIFCESFAGQNIGKVNNIFKEELFNNYYEKKIIEIENRLSAKDEFGIKTKIDIKQFLKSVVIYMIDNKQYSNVPLDLILDNAENREIYIRFLDENILIKRDPKSNNNNVFGYSEVVSFTFDEFRDYLISKYLVEEFYPNQDFEDFVTNDIDSNSQILEGCGTFLFHFLRKMENSEVKSKVYNLPWFKKIFIKSIFDVRDETVTDDEKEMIIEHFNSTNEHCYQIVNSLMRRSKKSFSRLNIEILFDLINELDTENYNEKFLSKFSNKTDRYEARFYNTIPLQELLDLTIKKFDNEEFDKDSKYHNLFNILLYLMPVHSNWRIKQAYERYAYKYIDKAKNQIINVLKSKNAELVKEVNMFCKEYEISI